MEEDYVKSGMDIATPVFESAIVFAAEYTAACGREMVSARDTQIGLMYAVRNMTGRHIGSLFPEDEDEEYDEEEDEEDSEEEWVRYTGTNEIACDMNECMDTWDEWEPDTPAARALKAAVSSIQI